MRCLYDLYRYGGKHGSLLLAGGTKGKRMALPNAEIMYEVIAADTERDNWKTAEEAKEYGLIDMIITSPRII